jgi:hypothetical protein
MKKIIILKNLSVKHLILLSFVWIFSLSAAAKNETDTIYYCEESGTKKYTVVKEKKRSKEKNYYTNIFLDFGNNNLDKSNIFSGDTKRSANDFPRLKNSSSISFSMYAMCGKKIIGPLSIMSGVGCEWTNYTFSKDVTIIEIDGVATTVPISSVLNTFSFMKKSQLKGLYTQVPLLLKMDFHRSFFIAAGVIGGVNDYSYTKVVFNDINGKKQTYKNHDIHLSTFRYGYTFRVGFRVLAIYVNYYVSPLFAKGEGPQVYPFITGISLKL